MIDIVSKRNWFFAISVVLILTGAAALLINGLELDIQFQGGTVIQIEMEDDTFDTGEIEQALRRETGKTVTAQKLKTYNPEDEESEINILMLKLSKENTLNDSERNQVVEIIKTQFKGKENANLQMESVEPFIGREMLRNSLLAALLASALIVVYVSVRFSVMQGLQAALTAMLALLHDALITISIYPIFRIPVNEAFVAALLTILGYSINDTIVVYDRIRENSRLYGRKNLEEIVNRSIFQSLTRAINTTLTTLICVVILYIFASANNIQTLKDFSLPLIVGLISGAYSSLFISGILWLAWIKSSSLRKAKGRA